MNSKNIINLVVVSFFALSFNAYSREWPLTHAETQALPGAYRKLSRMQNSLHLKKP